MWGPDWTWGHSGGSLGLPDPPLTGLRGHLLQNTSETWGTWPAPQRPAPWVPSTQPPTWDRARACSAQQRRGRASPRSHGEMDGQMDRAGCPRPHQQPLPWGALDTLLGSISHIPAGPWAAALRAKSGGRRAIYLDRCRPGPPTSALLSTSGKAALYCPPWGPSAASGAQETGDCHPSGPARLHPKTPILFKRLSHHLGPWLFSQPPSFYLYFCLQVRAGSSQVGRG